MKNYVKWEDEMTDEVSEVIGSDRSDAQAIVEAHIDLVKKAYQKGYTPKQAASLIFSEQEDDWDEDFKDGGKVDDESVRMLLSQAKEIKHHAEELEKALNKTKPVEPWVVAKAERASTDMSDLTHYIDGQSQYADGGTLANEPNNLDINEFLAYAHKEISYFLQDKLDGRTLTSNWVFTYNNKTYYVEPLVSYKAGKVNTLRTAHFVIYDDRENEVGTIDFYRGKFTANSIDFDWIDQRFKEGGKVCDGDCGCDDCKRSKLEEGGYVSTTTAYNDLFKPFVNDNIYQSGMDYILGGFTMREYDNVAVVNSRMRLPFVKIKHLAEKRLHQAVEDYKNEVTALLKEQPNADQYDLDREVAQEMSLMLETYLQSKYFGTNTEEIVEVIQDSSPYKTWLYRIEDRVAEYNSQLTMQPVFLQSSSTMTMDDIISNTSGISMQEMLEMLALINDRNEQ